MAEIELFVAFAAGLLSFFSPCLFPLLPGFLGFLTGNMKAGKKPDRLRLFLSSAFFVAGFGFVFMLFALVLNGLLGSASVEAKDLISRAGGIVVIGFGLYVMGILKLPFLDSEYRLSPKKTKWQYLTSFLFGATFAAGWSPCVGAVLGSVLALAATNATGAFFPMLAFSAGLGLPFLVVGALGTEAVRLLGSAKGFMKYFSIITGLFLLGLGVLMLTGKLAEVSNFIVAVQMTGLQ